MHQPKKKSLSNGKMATTATAATTMAARGAMARAKTMAMATATTQLLFQTFNKQIILPSIDFD